MDILIQNDTKCTLAHCQSAGWTELVDPTDGPDLNMTFSLRAVNQIVALAISKVDILIGDACEVIRS